MHPIVCAGLVQVQGVPDHAVWNIDNSKSIRVFLLICKGELCRGRGEILVTLLDLYYLSVVTHCLIASLIYPWVLFNVVFICRPFDYVICIAIDLLFSSGKYIVKCLHVSRGTQETSRKGQVPWAKTHVPNISHRKRLYPFSNLNGECRRLRCEMYLSSGSSLTRSYQL